jgi:hypothetical protein
MISIIRLFEEAAKTRVGKHADGAFMHLRVKDTQKNLTSRRRAMDMGDGSVRHLPSSKSKSGLKSAAYKVNNIKQYRLRKQKPSGSPYGR